LVANLSQLATVFVQLIIDLSQLVYNLLSLTKSAMTQGQRNLPDLSRNPIVVTLTLLIGVSGLVFAADQKWHFLPEWKRPSFSIVSPSNQSYVKVKETVKGTCQRLPEDAYHGYTSSLLHLITSFI
jgi:hypothetical protein